VLVLSCPQNPAQQQDPGRCPDHVQRLPQPVQEGVVNTGSITVTGSHEHGYTIPAWVDGQTQARIFWKGWDDGDRTGEPETFEKVVTNPRDLLTSLGAIDAYVNLELVSADLIETQPLTSS
jgi:hypothetical protein